MEFKVIRFRLVSMALLFFLLFSFSSRASQPTKYKIDFLGTSTINFARLESQDGDAVAVSLTDVRSFANENIYVDVYDSQGGSSPEIKSVFVSGFAARKLFVIVSWSADLPAIDTGGALYQVYVYDERIEDKNNMKRLVPDMTLAKLLGLGFDGTREGKRVSYKFKTARSIKRQLKLWGYK